MPEAMLRLGELKWELEREQFVERFKAWEAKPVDQRGPAPEPNFQPVARSLRARAQGLPVVRAVRPRALRRRLPRLPSRASRTRRSSASTRILKEFPNSRFVARRAHGARRGALQRQVRLRRRARRIRRRSSSTRRASSTASRCSRARGALAARQQRRGGEALRQRLRGHRQRRASVERRAAQAARRAPERGAQVPRRGLHRGREEHRAGRLRLPHEDRRRPVRRQGRAARSPSSSTIRRTTSAASRPTSCSSSSSRRAATRARWVLADRRRATTRSRTSRSSRRPTSARVTGYTAGSAVGEARRAIPAIVARRPREDREAAPRARAPAPREGAEGQDEPRRVRGRRGPLRRLPLEVRERDKTPTRFTTTSPRSTSTTSTRTPTRRRTTWRRRARCPNDEAQSEPLKTLRHDAIYNAIAALERVRFAELEARKKQAAGGVPGDRDRQEVRRGARALRAALSERSRAARALLPSGQASITTTASTTRR